MNVSHRDIKPENIIYDSRTGVAKIIDFGFACVSKEKLKVFCGTPSFMSPEIVGKSSYSGPASDVWACGILLYTMLAGTVPFKATTEKDLFRKIQKGVYSTPEGLTAGVKTLIKCMLCVDEDHRPRAEEILEECAWLRGSE